jgi:hypothetical protein
MKTGHDTNRSGLYVSECCLTEVTLSEGQMFPRCPACYALTVWEFVPRNQSVKVSSSPGLTIKSIRD